MSLQTTGGSAISTAAPFASVFATIGTEVTLADSTTKVQAIEVRPHENREFDLTDVGEMMAFNMRANKDLLADQTISKPLAPMTARVSQAQAAISEWRRSVDYAGVAKVIFGSRFDESGTLLSTACKAVALKYHATRDTLIKTFNTNASGGAVSGGSMLVNALSVGAAVAAMQDLVTILGPELYQSRVAEETQQLVFEMFKHERDAHNRNSIVIKTDAIKSLYGSADPATFWREMSKVYSVIPAKTDAAIRQQTAETIAELCVSDSDLKKMCADFVRSLKAVAPHLPGFESAHGDNDIMIFSVVMQSLAENGALLRGDRLAKGEYSTQELVDTLVDVAGYRTFDDPHRQQSYENALADLFAAFGAWSGYTPQAQETSQMIIAVKTINDGLRTAGVQLPPSIAHVTTAINAGAQQLKDVDSFQTLMQKQLVNNFDQARITMKWINDLCMLALCGPGVLIAAYIAAKFALKAASSQPANTSRPQTPVPRAKEQDRVIEQPRVTKPRVIDTHDSDYEEE